MPRVFISSTSQDLKTFRAVARAAIKQCEWDPDGMEEFGAGMQPTADDCRERVRRCDLLLLIVAFRYGSAPPGSDKSFTMLEVEAAREFGIPMRVLMAKPSWPNNLCDQGEPRAQIEQFRSSLNTISAWFEHELELADPENRLPQFGQLVRDVMTKHREDVLKLRQQLSTRVTPIRPVLDKLSALHDGRVMASITDICETFCSCHPAGQGLKPEDSLTSFTNAVADLAELPPAASGVHPLQMFLQLLAKKASFEKQILMHGCLRNEGEPIPPLPVALPVQPPAPLPAALPRPAGPGCRVVLQLKSAQQQTDGFLATAWFCQGEKYDRLPLEQDTWTEKNRVQRFNELYAEVLRRSPPRDRTIYEFVVSRKLINKDFEGWKIFEPDVGCVGRLVDYFPIVVRSLEREEKLSFAHGLKCRWEYVQPRLGDPLHLIEMGVDEADAPLKAIWITESKSGQRYFQVLNSDQSVACAVLNSPPGGSWPTQTMDLFKALLVQGVPMLIWPRKPLQPGAEEELLKLVRNQSLEALPRRVHDHRRGANECGITLVWDDPTQPLPKLDDSPLLSP